MEIEGDTYNISVFFTSLAQNANRIPFKGVETKGDSINFRLQSDFYIYSFRNKWADNYSKLQGSLSVDTVTTEYILEKKLLDHKSAPLNEEINFQSNGTKLYGTIWYPETIRNKGLVIVTSSGNADRSASRAVAILFSQMGFTTYHYEKRGTGNSGGNWEVATMKELLADDIKAISYFSEKTGIPLKEIGIKGSSQGATKTPYILSGLANLSYGIVVSCPRVALIDSDLNYWKNRNAEALGENLDEASALQRKVFEFIAGKLSRIDLEGALNTEKSKSWLDKFWVSNLDEVQTDEKLNFTPIPYFERIKQPVLILQGTMDEIIPTNSHELIFNALAKSNSDKFEIILLVGASHSMDYIGKSNFPYWSKLHPDYLKTVQGRIKTVAN